MMGTNIQHRGSASSLGFTPPYLTLDSPIEEGSHLGDEDGHVRGYDFAA